VYGYAGPRSSFDFFDRFFRSRFDRLTKNKGTDSRNKNLVSYVVFSVFSLFLLLTYWNLRKHENMEFQKELVISIMIQFS